MSQIWKSVVGFEGLYEVSDLGRVRGLDRYIGHYCGGTRLWRGRLVKPYCRKGDGYYTVPLSMPGAVVKRAYLHRIVAEAFKGAPPSREHEVAHEDGDKSNNAALNLFWKTPLENSQDNVRHGVVPRGEDHRHAVFTEETVRIARQLKRAGRPERKIAKDVGASRWTLRDMLAGFTWTHV